MKKELTINEMLNNYNLENVTVEAKFAEIDDFCDRLCDKIREIIDFVEDKINEKIVFETTHYFFDNKMNRRECFGIVKQSDKLLLVSRQGTIDLLDTVNKTPSIWELFDIWNILKEVLEKLKDTTTTERCTICNEEVEIPNIFDVHICPNCGNPIIPCNVCVGHKCSNCPLQEKELFEYQKLATLKLLR